MILLHNPTGVTPLLSSGRRCPLPSRLLPYFDMAYQGFASGDVDRDAFDLRQFIDDGHGVLLAQSFAKNMVLYHGVRGQGGGQQGEANMGQGLQLRLVKNTFGLSR